MFTAASASAVSVGAAQERTARIDEILVTAQKRGVAERVQDVPIAISAYSGDMIENMFAVNLTDIGYTAPNVNLADQGTVPGVANFMIRGMGTAGQSIPSSDPAVGVVVDGMPYGLIYGVVTDVFDLESVEVLRGPQGTLFGRNVTGGAVVMRTTRPSDEFDARVRLIAGSHDRRNVSAMVTGPLADSWNGKMAVMYNDRGGYWRNETLGGRQGEQTTVLVRPALTYEATNFSLTALAEYGSIESDGPSGRNFFLDPNHPTIPFENVPGRDIDPFGDNTTFTDRPGESDSEWVNLILEGNWDLWDGTLTTILGYRDFEQDSFGNIDSAPGTARFEFGRGSGLDHEQYTAEVRWAGPLTDRLSITTGVNYFDQEYSYRERRLLIDLLDIPAISTIDHRTFGLFVEGDFDLTDTLTLTVGGRFSYERKKAAIGIIGDPGATGTCANAGIPADRNVDRRVDFNDCRQPFRDSESWSNLSPKIGLAWAINPDMMTYASYTRGFRSGGYNVRFTDATIVTQPDNPTSTPGPYDEEVVDAFEIGVKSTLFGGLARVNVAAFYNEYDDLQRAANNQQGVQTIFNAASGTIKGFEIDAQLLVTDGLTIEASYGYTDAGYDQADFLEEATGRPAGEFDFQMVPENTFSGAVTYEHDVGTVGSLIWRGSYSFVDSVASDDFNFLILRSYELFDASLSYVNREGNLKVSLYGKNLKDENYAHFGFDNSAIGSRTVWLSPPRTYGVELQYNF